MTLGQLAMMLEELAQARQRLDAAQEQLNKSTGHHKGAVFQARAAEYDAAHSEFHRMYTTPVSETTL